MPQVASRNVAMQETLEAKNLAKATKATKARTQLKSSDRYRDIEMSYRYVMCMSCVCHVYVIKRAEQRRIFQWQIVVNYGDVNRFTAVRRTRKQDQNMYRFKGDQ